jgi:uncharacterized protein
MLALREAQLRMARHLRNPVQSPAPEGVEARRLKVYRELVYNNIERFISAGFPVLRSLYNDGQWRELVQGFLEGHRCSTPYFLEISQEFIHYLVEGHRPRPCDPPFAAELAHYEWVELALDVADAEPPPPPPPGDPLALVPRLSPLAWLLSYAYPVHRVGPALRPSSPGEPTFLVVYRGRDEAVGFVELNAASARLLQQVQENTAQSGAQLLGQLAGELGMAPETLTVYGAEQLAEFGRLGIISLDRQ